MRLRILGTTLAVSLAAAAAPNTPPTFHKDVLPVLQKRCQECHRPGEIGPMSLLSYQDARPWAKAMREAVLSKKMPPWFADAERGKFENDRSLAPQEIDALVAWADSGAREGDAKDAPGPVHFADGWSIGKPDVVLELLNAFPVPASGVVDYQFIVVPSGFTEDKWVEKVEVRPGVRSVVHHVVVRSREPGSPWLANARPGVPMPSPPNAEGRVQIGQAGKRPEDKGVGRFLAEPGVEIICTYVPGGVPYLTKPGQARLVKAGSDLVFQIHYTTNGKAAQDRTRIGFVFAKNPPKERLRNMLVYNPLLRIPAGAPNQRVEARATLHETAQLVSLFPHMHVRGKGFEYRAVYPTGESEVLLRVPKYDFNWQLTYYLDKPKTLPKGTRIECTAWFDNSPNNPHNPDPNAEVFWGDQTWEEMLAGFFDLAFDVSLDPRDLTRPRPAAARGLD